MSRSERQRIYLVPANDTKERVFGQQNFSLPRAGIQPLALEASALTTELPSLLMTVVGFHL